MIVMFSPKRQNMIGCKFHKIRVLTSKRSKEKKGKYKKYAKWSLCWCHREVWQNNLFGRTCELNLIDWDNPTYICQIMENLIQIRSTNFSDFFIKRRLFNWIEIWSVYFTCFHFLESCKLCHYRCNFI